MNLTPEDIEKIVRQVLHALLQSNAGSSSEGSGQVAAPAHSIAGSTSSVAATTSSTAAPVLKRTVQPASQQPAQLPVGQNVSVNPASAQSVVTPVPAFVSAASVAKPTPAASASAGEVVVDASVVSATLLGAVLPKANDRSVQSIRVSSNAVVTPAAKDILRERKIQIVRVSSVQTVKSEPNVANKAPPRPQRLVVAGTSNNMDSLGKQVCPKQANVLPKLSDDSAVLRSVLESLKAGHQAAIVWVDSPHNVCWQAARHDSLRPVVVSQWSDLANAIREVPANLLILSKKNWTIPALGNATRLFFEHLKKSN